MDAAGLNIRALLIFAVAWAVCCAGAVHLAGHFPLAEAPGSGRSRSGTALILVNAVLLLALFALTLLYSSQEVRWPFTVVLGGMIFLFAPFAIQDLPEALKNGKVGLVALFLLLLAALVLLWESGARHSIVGQQNSSGASFRGAAPRSNRLSKMGEQCKLHRIAAASLAPHDDVNSLIVSRLS